MTSNDSNGDTVLAFEREKWADEVRLRQQEMDARRIEAAAKAREQENQAAQIKFTQDQAQRNRWTNPLVVAVFAVAIGAGGSAVVALLNGNAQNQNERIKADQGLILEAIKANNPDKAAANLSFMVDTALIADERRREELRMYLKGRKPGEGPVLPTSTPTQEKASTPADIFKENGGSIGYLVVEGVNWNNAPKKIAGTCFVINKQGYALTTATPFGEEWRAGEINIQVSLGSRGGTRLKTDLIKLDRDLGLALIKLTGQSDYVPVKLSTTQVSVGETVSILGYPLESELSVLVGTVSSLNEARGALGIIAAAASGHSGSPVFNKNGEVEAVVLGGLVDGQRVIAAPIQFSRPLLALAGVQ
jgi:Trypsin-like peptidase domain